jgi:hypothetical protein
MVNLGHCFRYEVVNFSPRLLPSVLPQKTNFIENQIGLVLNNAPSGNT